MSAPKDGRPDDMDDLAGKTKEELELIKLRREINAIDREKAGKRGGLSETARLLLGAAIGGAITFAVSWMLEDRKAENALRMSKQALFLESESRCWEEADRILKAQCACALMDRGMPFEASEAQQHRDDLSRLCSDTDELVVLTKKVAEDSSSAGSHGLKPILIANENRIDSLKMVLHSGGPAIDRVLLQQELVAATKRSDSIASQSSELERIRTDIQKLSAMQQAMDGVIAKMHETSKTAIRHIKVDEPAGH